MYFQLFFSEMIEVGQGNFYAEIIKVHLILYLIIN